VSQDYNEAIQHPGSCFGDAELRAAEPVTNALGLPLPCSGNFADVYHLRHPATGASWAVKCFTRSVPGRHERYDEISRHLGRARLPFTIDFAYLEEGIRVRGQWYPVVKMQWVEGLLLNQFVRDNLARPALLEKLIRMWAPMARRLREAEVAHGDLQHGNVLLVPGSRTTKLALKLIDYDGMYVPALAGRPSGEVGHPAYQHPQRLREATAGPDVDRVPLLVIATALRCLATAGAPLWERYDNGDNLLFREADLRAPAESALFRELWRLPDPLARVLVGRLALACHGPLEEAPPVTALLAEDLLPMLTPEQEGQARALLGNNAVAVSASASPRKRTRRPVPVGAPAGHGFDFEDGSPPRPRPGRRGPRPVVIVWAWVGFLMVVLAVVVPIAWYLGAVTSGEPHRTAPTTRRTRPQPATRKATEPAAPDRGPAEPPPGALSGSPP
jgi:hypothetical protein